MLTRRTLGICLAIATAVSAGASSTAIARTEPAPAVVGYWGEDYVGIADAQGLELRRFADFNRFSLARSVIAGELSGRRHSSERVVGFDTASGDRLYRIRNATNPVVSASGKRVAFLPTFRREQYVNSVWMRSFDGTIRKVVQFRAGPGLPGIRHGMKGDGGPLDLALDAKGRFMALAFGLEPLRYFDVWIIDTKTEDATRMTRGRNSHNPSLSPDGQRLAVRVERDESCPDPTYGEILIGKIRVISVATGEAQTLTEFDCDLVYDTPRWISNDMLVAVRATRDAGQTQGWNLDIVRIDPTSGAISDLYTEGNPCCVTASPGLQKIAFSFTDRDGFAVLDLGDGSVVEYPAETSVPHLSGEGRA